MCQCLVELCFCSKLFTGCFYFKWLILSTSVLYTYYLLLQEQHYWLIHCVLILHVLRKGNISRTQQSNSATLPKTLQPVHSVLEVLKQQSSASQDLPADRRWQTGLFRQSTYCGALHLCVRGARLCADGGNLLGEAAHRTHHNTARETHSTYHGWEDNANIWAEPWTHHQFRYKHS